MALIVTDPTASFKVRTANWRQSPGVIYNRSEFTGKTRALRIGPAARWTCELELAPRAGDNDASLIDQRAFVAAASRGDFALKIPFFDTPQTATTLGTSYGGTQAGFQIGIDGLPPSTLVLNSGAVVTLVYDVDQYQPCIILDALTSNASGQGILTMNQPARLPVLNGTSVLLANPQALMRARDGFGWSVAPGLIHQFQTLQLEEVF